MARSKRRGKRIVELSTAFSLTQLDAVAPYSGDLFCKEKHDKLTGNIGICEELAWQKAPRFREQSRRNRRLIHIFKFHLRREEKEAMLLKKCPDKINLIPLNRKKCCFKFSDFRAG